MRSNVLAFLAKQSALEVSSAAAAGELTDDSSQATYARRGWALILLTVIAAFNTIDRQVITILTPAMKHEFVLTDTEVGLIGLVYGILFAFGAPPLAWLAQRTSRRAVIAGCMAAFSAATVGCGLATNYLTILLSRIGVGAGEAGTSSPSQSLIADQYPAHERTMALSIFGAASKPGGFIAFLAGGWLAQLYGWRVTFIILGVPGLIIAVLAWLFVREPPRVSLERSRPPSRSPASNTFTESFAYLRRTRSFWHILIGHGLWSMFALGLVFWAPNYLVRTFGLKLGSIGTAMAFYTLIAGTTGVILIGWLCQRMQVRDIRWLLGILMIAAAVAVPFVWGFLITRSMLVASLCAIAPVSMYTATLGPCSAAMQAVVPIRLRTLTVALAQCFLGLLGMGLGPMLPGALSDLLQPWLGTDSLRCSLICFSLLWIWAIAHFHCANRSLARDIRAAQVFDESGA